MLIKIAVHLFYMFQKCIMRRIFFMTIFKEILKHLVNCKITEFSNYKS